MPGDAWLATESEAGVWNTAAGDVTAGGRATVYIGTRKELAMLQSGLLLLLLTAPVVDLDRTDFPGAKVWALPRLDPCAEAERIAAQRPCLRAEDCGALREWKRLFGAPRVEQLEPQFAVRRVSRAEIPTSYLCLARAGGRR